MRKLAGGYQGGAWLVEPTAVLKWMAPGWTAEELGHRAALVDRAISAGWPTVRWRAHGTLDDGSPYVVTDFAVGVQPAGYDDEVVDRLLAAVESQRGLADQTVEQDWSYCVRAVTFGGDPRFIQRDDVMRFSPKAAALVATIDERCAGLDAIALPMDDLVHGDLCTDNAIIDERGRLLLIDAQQLGRGTRAVDVAGMLRHAAFLGSPPSVLTRLRAVGEAIAGRDVFAVCLASAVLGVLSFGTWNWPEQVDAAIPPLEALLRA